MLRGRPTYPLAYWTTTPSTRRLDDLGEVPKRRLVIECIRDQRDCFDGVGTNPLRVMHNATARCALGTTADHRECTALSGYANDHLGEPAALSVFQRQDLGDQARRKTLNEWVEQI